jgi:hypothetical protein
MALEFMVSMIGASIHAGAPNPKESLESFGANLLNAVRAQGFPGLEPTLSDLASAELEDALHRLLTLQQRYLEAALKP